MPTFDVRAILRRLLWLAAAVAFLAGFKGYVFHDPQGAAKRRDTAYAPAPSAPSSEDWNLPKHL
jgi:hypothetical protein